MPDIHRKYPEPTALELEAMEPRIRAFIFPSIPRTDYEIEAFNKAVVFQIDHEKTIAAAMANHTMPDGTKSFGIGHFSMTFEDGTFAGRLDRRTICPTAYGILLEAGLMYKGVEGRLPCCVDH